MVSAEGYEPKRLGKFILLNSVESKKTQNFGDLEVLSVEITFYDCTF